MTRRQAIYSALLAPFAFKAMASGVACPVPVEPITEPLDTLTMSVVNPAWVNAAYQYQFIVHKHHGLLGYYPVTRSEVNEVTKSIDPWPVRWNEWDAEGNPVVIPPFIVLPGEEAP